MLVGRMRELHPDLFHGVSDASFDAATDALRAALPTLSDDQFLVGLMRLVASISAEGRDGHMGIWPPDNPGAVRRYPVRLWEFPDGLYLTAATPPGADLVGGRVLAVNGRPLAEVERLLDPVVPRDNASNLRAARTVFLTSAEVLDGLGLSEDPSRMRLEVELPGGARRTADVPAVSGPVYADWVGGWELPLPPRHGLRFTQRPNVPLRLTYLPAQRALVVDYRVVDEASTDAVEAIRSAMARHRVDRLVVDLRENGGGEAGGYRELLRFLASPAVDRAGRLSVLIGRLTFSAGASLAVLLQRRAANAVFLGEDTGGAPNFWADPDLVTLPNSGLRALVSTRFFGIGGPADGRASVAPDVRVPLTAADYFGGRDPVLAAALAPPSS